MTPALHRLLLLALAASCLAAAAWLNPRLKEERRRLDLTQADPLDNAPPLLAFTTVALGGFRGILADLLWLRSGRLQEEGKYFELVQLADWITKLEPRFTSVWAFHGWNMAYNISVLFDRPEDRWRWVQNGIRLLRDEGLVYNPGNARLLFELGWIFQHKIGANLDQAHTFYKRRLAEDMMAIFDGARPDYDELAALRLSDPAGTTPEGRRAKALTDLYRMDPARMKTIDGLYGPLDWRLPQAHAIYWAYRSREVAAGPDRLSADRMIFQSLADAFRSGSLFVSTTEDVFVPSPNLDLLPRVLTAYDEAERATPNISAIADSRRTFLAQAIVILYTYQRTTQAQALLDDLRARSPGTDLPATLDAFVARQLTSEIKAMNQDDATAYVEGFLVQSVYFQAIGDADRAQGFARAAQLIWSEYMKTKTTDDFRERVGLPPLEEMRRVATERVAAILQSEAARSALSPAP